MIHRRMARPALELPLARGDLSEQPAPRDRSHTGTAGQPRQRAKERQLRNVDGRRRAVEVPLRLDRVLDRLAEIFEQKEEHQLIVIQNEDRELIAGGDMAREHVALVVALANQAAWVV